MHVYEISMRMCNCASRVFVYVFARAYAVCLYMAAVKLVLLTLYSGLDAFDDAEREATVSSFTVVLYISCN